MSKYSFSLLLVLASFNLHGQNISAFNRIKNFVILKIDNPIVISGVCNCNEIIVKATNGDITKIGECEYKFNPKGPGNAFVTIFKVELQDTVELARKEFRVIDFPDVVPTINDRYNCSVEKDFLVSSYALTAPVINWDISLDYPVQSFDILIIRNNEVVFKKSYFNSVFSEELIEEFKKLHEGDMIFISNVIVKNVIDSERKLPPINFIIE